MDILKEHVTWAPVLSFPDFTRPFFIHTDACDGGLGIGLIQKDDKDQKDVEAYASRYLHKAELPYSPSEMELIAVIWVFEHFCPFV